MFYLGPSHKTSARHFFKFSEKKLKIDLRIEDFGKIGTVPRYSEAPLVSGFQLWDGARSVVRQPTEGAESDEGFFAASWLFGCCFRIRKTLRRTKVETCFMEKPLFWWLLLFLEGLKWYDFLFAGDACVGKSDRRGCRTSWNSFHRKVLIAITLLFSQILFQRILVLSFGWGCMLWRSAR